LQGGNVGRGGGYAVGGVVQDLGGDGWVGDAEAGEFGSQGGEDSGFGGGEDGAGEAVFGGEQVGGVGGKARHLEDELVLGEDGVA
jgi:hypothetical protein